MDGDVWTAVEGSGHPLADATSAVTLGPRNCFGARYFRVALRDRAGEVSSGDIACP